MKATLLLENGMCFTGKAFGKIKETVGEVVFNTGMTGYQEVLTDPSYYGQIVTMTYPLIGNYGVNLDDIESNGPKVKAFIVRERSQAPHNFRCEMELETYLKKHGIMGVEGIDTRALTKVLRNTGTMCGILTVGEDRKDEEPLMQKIKDFDNSEAVKNVTTEQTYVLEGKGPHIAVMDFGIKQNILRSFQKRGCKLTIFPAFSDPQAILNHKPDGIFLSNGPGDPKDVPQIIENIKTLMFEKPTFGICLGHQLICLALGGDTERLKFGHRGCNHPVKDLRQDRVYITSQNHGYVVQEESIKDLPLEVTHINLNDGTIEGFVHKEASIMSVQYHPEASPGPQESGYLFDEFISKVKGEMTCQKIQG